MVAAIPSPSWFSSEFVIWSMPSVVLLVYKPLAHLKSVAPGNFFYNLPAIDVNPSG